MHLLQDSVSLTNKTNEKVIRNGEIIHKLVDLTNKVDTQVDIICNNMIKQLELEVVINTLGGEMQHVQWYFLNFEGLLF